MTLAGFRPALKSEYEEYDFHHRARIAMKPGITGMWQVSGRSDITDFEEVVKLDTEYIRNWSIKHCVDLCGSKEADIAIIRMLYTSEQTNEELHEGDESQVKVLTPEEAIEASLYQELYSCCAPAKLYRADIAKAVQFPLGKISEDLATCHLFLDKAKQCCPCDSIYRMHKLKENCI